MKYIDVRKGMDVKVTLSDNVQYSGKVVGLDSDYKSVCVEFENNNGAGGLGGKIQPSAVLVIKDGHTKLVNVKNQDSITKILDMVPDVIDKFTSKDKDKV